jgi:hypothetical protein
MILLALCGGCIEPFEPHLEESGEVLVIEGRITDLPGMQTVTVSRSSAYKQPEFKPVSGCVVRVEDETGDGITYTEQTEGVYQSLPETGFVAVGKSYKLLVFTPDGGVYESDYDSLLACAPIDQLSYKVETQGTSNPDVNYYGIRFFIDIKGDELESRNYLWNFEETWEYYSTYRIQYMYDGSSFLDYSPELHGFNICYITSYLDAFQVGSSAQMEANQLHQQPLYFVSNQTPRLRHTYSLRVLQHSLSNGAFDYWERLMAQTGGTGGLFETQPSSTRGNVYNINDQEEKVLGFFFASQVKEKRLTLSEKFEFPIAEFDCPLDTANSLEDFDVDYPYLMYSLSPFGRGSPFGYSYRECHDCTYRGGVTTKPDYWD